MEKGFSYKGKVYLLSCSKKGNVSEEDLQMGEQVNGKNRTDSSLVKKNNFMATKSCE